MVARAGPRLHAEPEFLAVRTLPKIGQRVRYAGANHVGPCVGTVVKITANHVPAPGEDEDDERCRYVQAPFTPEGWRAHVKYDTRPTPWCYGDADTFCPSVAEVEPA